ncbi:MAG: hypothetical protein D6816_02420 [Bacteroidetes bacterium]|nr:MAG: hypothetical protein D6816_02420 [Bacteroidota bacterium]
MSTLTSIAETLDFEVADLNDFVSASSTIRLRQGVPELYVSVIGDNKLNARSTLHNANLSRITVLQNRYRNGDGTYLLVSGVLSDVHLSTEVEVDGTYVDITDFLRMLYEAKVGHSVDPENFKATLHKIGFRFDGEATLMWHHFGADPDKVDQLISWARDAGATDALGSIDPMRRGNIQSVWRFDGVKVPIVSADVNPVDRSMNPRHQGFVDFVEAAVSSFFRSAQLRAKANKMDTLASNAEGAEAEKYRALATLYRRQSVTWASNLAGVQRRLQVNPDGSVTPMAAPGETEPLVYDATNAPIGRMSTADGHEIDLWKQSTQAPSAAAVIDIASAVDDIDDDDEAF